MGRSLLALAIATLIIDLDLKYYLFQGLMCYLFQEAFGSRSPS